MGKKSSVRPSIGEGKVTEFFGEPKEPFEQEKGKLEKKEAEVVEEQTERQEEGLEFSSEFDVEELLDKPSERVKGKYTFSLPFYTVEQIDKFRSWVGKLTRERIPMSAVVAVCVEYTVGHLEDKEAAKEILELVLKRKKDFGKRKK